MCVASGVASSRKSCLAYFWMLFLSSVSPDPQYFSPHPDLGLEEAHVLHQAVLEVTGMVYYILNDYTNLRQIRLKLQPTG